MGPETQNRYTKMALDLTDHLNTLDRQAKDHHDGS
jgi:hypothetical protein